MACFLLIQKDSVLAEVRKKDVWGSGETWLPGGGIKEGETPENGFIRELKEELGIKPVDYFKLYEVNWERDEKSYLIHYFVVTKWLGEIQNNEAEKLKWVNINHIEELSEENNQKAFKDAMKKLVAFC